MEYVVVLAGGHGERFWPESRRDYPKQFLNIYGQNSMIQTTINRMTNKIPIENILVMTRSNYSSIILEQIPQLPKDNILIEPEAKNTAACIGLAAIHLKKKNPTEDPVMIVVPSDHLIKNINEFDRIIYKGVNISKVYNKIVTIGIKPTRPETSYGYLECDTYKTAKISESYIVRKFIEKPDAASAELYFKSGKYLWNSGIYIFRVSTILDKIKIFLPTIYTGLQEIEKFIGTDMEEIILAQQYKNFSKVSIDYGIMENLNDITVIPAGFEWDDIGSWNAVERITTGDKNGNIIKGNVQILNTRSCIIKGNEKLIVTLGIEDLVIVQTEDITLVCPKDKAQDIKEILKELQEKRMYRYL